MDLVVAQGVTGLANASSLFLVASGLSLIFGVTRIVNFAHGAFYMLGAYAAVTLAPGLAERLGPGPGFWLALPLAAAIVAAIGVAVEVLLLRRIYRAPSLFQLLATFGVTLMVEDLVVLVFGPDDLIGPRAPGLGGSVTLLGHAFPSYDLFLMLLGPAVLGLISALLHRTRFGILLRAATEDRDMVAALGVNQSRLFTGIFALGIFLAALGGALQIPRDAVTHQMDLSIIVEVFAVVIIGGLGSLAGAFLAAVLVAELNAFGILVFPGISMVMVFLAMAVVLVVRPYGLLGRPFAPDRAAAAATARPWRPFTARERLAVAAGIAAAAALPLVAGAYGLTVAAEVMIAVVFAASLQLLMSAGGLDSFGHAAFFGLGAYGAALAVQHVQAPMALALLAGPLLALAGALAVGWFCIRLTGVHFAMLTLALAQIAWAVAFQWVDVTGGDNGLLGIWPAPWATGPAAYYWLTLAAALLTLAFVRQVVFSPFGYALRAARDSAGRAEAIGIDRRRMQYAAFAMAGTLAGLAGALFAFLKGSIFPDSFAVPLSVDALVMVLIGGVGTVSGAAVGAVLYKTAEIWLISTTDHSKLVLGAGIVALVLVFPRGVVGTAAVLADRLPWPRRRTAGLRPALAPPGGAAEP
ncbi:ABC transporter permease [Labrys wisconsinensis]|uniref:ABC transporter permease n=1 Tax=Labrys wisconsinensis TaxID=425677 RepID=UPI003520149F